MRYKQKKLSNAVLYSSKECKKPDASLLLQLAKSGCLHSFPFDEVPTFSFQDYKALQHQIFITQLKFKLDLSTS